MHKPSTFPSDTAEMGGTPFGTTPRETGQRCEWDAATITRLLIQSGETFVSRKRRVRKEYWCTAAPKPIRTGCKSVKNSTKSSKTFNIFRQTSEMLWDTSNYAFYSDRHLFTVQASFCRIGIPTDMFVWGLFSLKHQGEWYIVLGCQAMPRYLSLPTHLSCSFPTENNVITKVAEWKRPQVSFRINVVSELQLTVRLRSVSLLS